jgi:hypothetical protein
MQHFIFFNIQSNINFNEWISYLTLCLSPLFVHLLAGVPLPIYLCARRPRWHDYLGHVNPTSIIWRYFAITDRRARTKSSLWTSTTMAASNTLFWTSSGWDGSEKMVGKSIGFQVRKPSGTHMGFFSFSTLKTVIVAGQGVQALHALILGISGSRSFGDSIAITTIFIPLATFGLLRLPAALWLTDVENYRSEDEDEPGSSNDYEMVPICSCSAKHTQSTTHPLHASMELATNYHTTHSWQGIVVRAFFLLVIFLLLSVGVASLMPPKPLGYTNEVSWMTLTWLVMGLFYIMFLGVTFGTLAFYILRGHATTTVIPCVGHIWYKIYTGAFFAMMVLLFTIAALETRKTPCGMLTTLSPAFDGRNELCGNSTYVLPMDSPKRTTSDLPWVSPVNSLNISSWDDYTPPFGIIWRMPNGTFEVIIVEAWCQLHANWQSKWYFDLEPGKFFAS